MSADALLLFGLLVVAVVLFVTERVSLDTVAVLIMGTLMVSGVLSIKEGLSGFSNQATVTIAAMLVVSEGIRRTGALKEVSRLLAGLGRRSFWLGLSVMMGVVALCSAFINNTAAVAIFIPVVIGIANDMGVSPSKMLMPLSFAAMLGGVCTLVGTSTNLLVSSIAHEAGQPAFSMFEFTPLGLLLLAVGLAYLLLMGVRLIPARRTERPGLTGTFEMNEYLTDVVMEDGSRQLGLPLNRSSLVEDLDLDVVSVFREDGERSADGQNTVLQAGDTVRIRGGASEIARLLEREDVSLKPRKEWTDAALETGAAGLVEAVVAPDSGLVGTPAREVDFYENFGAVLLAIRSGSEVQQEELGQVRLSGGDSLLLSLDSERVEELKRNPSFVVVSEVGLRSYRTEKMPVALAILVGVVGAAALGVVPIVISAVVGVLLLLLTGCLTNEEAYGAINWQVILLLAGVLPLGIAMRKTGAARMMSDVLIDGLGDWGPHAVLAGFVGLTMLLANVIGNQASAAVLAPIAIEAASTLQVGPRPFLMGVTFAASLSFLSPVAYQTNAMVYGAGQYKFTDFTRAGAPLNLILWIVISLMIPVIWPL